MAPMSDLPMWLGPGDGPLFCMSNDKAVAAGLTFRPAAETLRDALDHGAKNKGAIPSSMERALIGGMPAAKL